MKTTFFGRILALIATALAFAGVTANAAIFTVTNTNDSGLGSLRQAVINANAMAGEDFISFDPVVFSTPQTITVLSTLTFNSGDNLPLTITGPGAGLLTISGGDTQRIFAVTAGDTAVLSDVTLTRAVNSAINNAGTLTVTNITFHDNTSGFGGAIYTNGAALTVIGCTFTENEATSGSATGQGGGAIHSNTAGTVSISDSAFTGNDEIGNSGGGGAIRNRGGTMTITNSTFTGNTAVDGAGGGAIVNSSIMSMTGCSVTGNSGPNGGGITNGGQLTMTTTVVSGNTASGSGGGISASGTLTITDSTISNNTATTGIGGGLNLLGTTINISNTTISGNMAPGGAGDGGGIRTTGFSNLNNVTVSGNMAGRDGGAILATGTSTIITNITSCTIVNNTATRAAGGVWRASTTNPVNLRNSIFANNTDNGTAPDLRGTVVSQGYNLIKSTTGAAITGDTATNLTNVDPNLKPLADYGGLTQTHALGLGSPAIDKGDSSTLTTDQRGFSRPVDASGIPNVADGADIGAVEAQPPTAVDDMPSTNEDNAVVIPVLANDLEVDNDGVTIIEVTQGTNGSAATDGTTVTYTPNANFNGQDSFTYRTSDTIFQSNAATVTVTVNPINDAPSFMKGADQTVNEDAGAQTIPGWATNISQGPNETGQTLTFNTEVTGTTGGLTFADGPAIDPLTGDLSYTTAADSNGTATVSVTLSDNGSNTPPNENTSPAQIFTIAVNPVNDAPTLAPIADPAPILEDSPQQTINLAGITAGGGESQTLTVTATSNNPGLIPDPTVSYASPASTGSLSYTPVANQSGAAVITVTVTDDGGTANGGVNTFSRTVTVNVTAVNDQPSFTASNPPAVLADSGTQTLSGFATFNPGPNESGQSVLAYLVSNVSNPALFSAGPAVVTDGTLTYTPAPGTGGTSTFDLRVQDNGGTANGGIDSSELQTFTITVNKPAAFTSASSTTFVVGTAGTFTVVASGFPTPAIGIGGDSLPFNLTFVDNGDGTATISGMPAAGTGGVYNLTFTASNGIGDDAVQDFILTVNEAPVITSADSAAFTVGNTGSFSVTATGFPSPTLSESGTLPVGVTFNSGTGLLSGTPAAGKAGTYPLTFTAANGVGSDDVQNFTLTVTDAVCVAPPADLVAWFPADGNAIDVEGGHNGALLAGSGFASGKVGQAFTFDGVDAVVEVPNDPSWDFGTNAFTVDAWVNFSAVSGNDVLVAHDEGAGSVNKWIFRLRAGFLEWDFDGSAVGTVVSDAAFTPVVGQWYHVAVTRNATTYKFYVDGEQNGTDRFDGSAVPAANAPLRFGKAEGIPSLNGLLDEVQIFHRALSGPEIQSVYNSSTEGFCVDALQTASAASLKIHSSAGPFEINLPLAGQAGVECRTGSPNGDHTILVRFNNPIAAGIPSVSAGSISGAPTFEGETMTINLTGVPNAQEIILTLTDVQDAFGQTLSNVSVPMGVLLGDVNGSKSVSASDVSLGKSVSGSAVSAVNFPADVNLSGTLNASDIGIVKAASGSVIP